MKLYVKDEQAGYRPATFDERIEAAKQALNRRFRRGTPLLKPADVSEFCQMRLATLEHELFCVLWLDNRHRVITFEELFRGTIDGAAVHTREVVKSALAHNAAACILTHSHPSGIAEPSGADERITAKIVDALRLIDIRVLDHLVVGSDQCVSFAERGLL